MSQTPVVHADSLRIGSVDFVSPDEIKILLDIEAPESVALNAGGARPFPRVNGYILLPVDDAYLVGQIAWLTIERSNFPKRRGVQDFGVLDLPYPLRKMSVNPLGTLSKTLGPREAYKFRRGADALPSVGSPVLLPTELQLRSIVESGDRRHVLIGGSALAGDAEVRIDPNRLFGRHLAVLGNTGSGKSCSVAGLIRWSLEAAKERRVDGAIPNARFIILDPNGEYSRAFADDVGLKAQIFKVDSEASTASLKVPLWLWNTAEWTSFTKASAKTQRPVLVQALRFVRDEESQSTEDSNHALRRFLRTIVLTIRAERNAGTPWAVFPKPKAFFEKIDKWRIGLEAELPQVAAGDGALKLKALVDGIEGLCVPRRKQYASLDFTKPEVDALFERAREAHAAFGGADSEMIQTDADSPRPFTGEDLIRSVEATAEMMGVSEHVETLLIRLRGLLADRQMKGVIGGHGGLTLDQWLTTYVGGPASGTVTIIDLSLVPSEIVHVVTAVIARMTFEALQRYRQFNGSTLPTVIVMEEAHTFIKRYKDDIDDHDASSICCQVFERIAREGRKFGLGLVLSSQRPSELSPTVLSQCNTFLLHRLSNDRDQELVSRLVPDNLRGLLRELPSLPSQQAILLGWASELPILVRMNDLPQSQQPRSDDPDFWEVWTGQDADGQPVTRDVDWKSIADAWQGIEEPGSGE